MRTFRGMDSLSGNLRVEGGSRQRKGVRRLTGRASCNSPEELAGSDAESGLTAGGDAHTSAALTAGHKTDADPAKTTAKEAGGTPKKDEAGKVPPIYGGGLPEGRKPGEKQWTPRLTLVEGEMQEIETLPRDGREFAEAVNREIYLVGVVKSLLTDDDARVKHRMCEQLVDIAYGKNAKVAEAARPVYVCDIPSAVAERGWKQTEEEEKRK
jgi:hypothetical protein